MIVAPPLSVRQWPARRSTSVNAFEIQVGPYAVTHLRLTKALGDAGAQLPQEGVGVFLTDTLAPPTREGFARQATLFQQRLAVEQERASRVKAPDTYVTVVLGNPPYFRDTSGIDQTGRKRGGMIRHGAEPNSVGLLRDFLNRLPSKVRANHGLNLYNDYVYFLRWGIWKATEQHPDRDAVLTFITASSYLTGPAYGGVRQMLREQFDEVWVVDLGGEGRGTRKDENVFEGVLTPVAIIVAIRSSGAGSEDGTATPATVRFREIAGTRDEKLESLGSIESLVADSAWDFGSSDWQAPLVPPRDSFFTEWPSIDSLMPWTARGIQFSRTWPIAESKEVARARWDALVSAAPNQRGELLKETSDTQVSRTYRSFLTDVELARLDSVAKTAEPDEIERVAYRSFDRQWCIADRRVIDRPRPPLWRVRSDSQMYLTYLPDQTLSGPAVVVHTDVPDLNATIGSNGGLVIPAYRDAAATDANVTEGLLDRLSEAYAAPVSAQDVVAYIIGLLGTPAYTERFADELIDETPRVPFTDDIETFRRVVAFGREVAWAATQGLRFGPRSADDNAGVAVLGQTRNTKAVAGAYPSAFEYDPELELLTVGDGEFQPVPRDVWEFEVSGFKVVESWLAYRMRSRSGRTSSDLDHVRPLRWTYSAELLGVLGAVEHLVSLAGEAGELLDTVISGGVLGPDWFPTPRESERVGGLEHQQQQLGLSGE